MPFSDHFRNASVNKGILTAECRKFDAAFEDFSYAATDINPLHRGISFAGSQTWVPSTINLDDHLGNNDGKFDVMLTAFSRSATDITLYDGILSARLQNKAGEMVDARYDLGTLFHSKDGAIARMSRFADHFRNASVTNGILTAECKKADGQTWVPSAINLDDHLGNINGKFDAMFTAFSRSATDITLYNGILYARLQNKARKMVDARYDLGTLFHSKDGAITRIAP